MLKEYKLTIQAFGRNELEAVECAVRMLNEGASFDELVFLDDWPEALEGENPVPFTSPNG